MVSIPFRAHATRATLVVIAVLAVSGCAGPRPVEVLPSVTPPTPTARVPVVARHYDQVCRPSGGAPRAVVLDEVVDTVGLGDALEDLRAELGPNPAGLSAGSRPRLHSYDFIVRYGFDGTPRALGTWATTAPEKVTRRLEDTFAARVRTLRGLLQDTGFRITTVFGPLPNVSLTPPIECMPHVRHEEGAPPTGLPAGVRTWGGALRGGLALEGSTQGVVRIHVAPTGRVTEVEAVDAPPELLERIRDVVAGLSFDPALSNGTPVAGTLTLGFRFSPSPP